MDFRIAFKRILMKCCCAGKFRKQQKIYQQQQQIRLNKRKEHKKKKLLHQQQKQKFRDTKETIDGEKDSLNEETSRKSSFKQITNSSSVNKIEEIKKVRLDDQREESKMKSETNLNKMANSLTNLEKPNWKKQMNNSQIKIIEQSEQNPNPDDKATISHSWDDLKTNKLDKDQILKSILLTKIIFRTNSNLKKSKSEITNITKCLEVNLNDEQINRSIKLDFNNNEKLSKPKESNLNEIILKTNLKQLSNQNPDYCHFKI